MVEWKKKSKKKPTGGVNNAVNAKSKSLSEKGGKFSKTTLAKEDKRYKERTKGGNEKIKLSHAQSVLVSQGAKTIKCKILDILENPANKHYVRQKIITKGTTLKVDLEGKETKVKVVSRPGQDGLISGVVIK